MAERVEPRRGGRPRARHAAPRRGGGRFARWVALLALTLLALALSTGGVLAADGSSFHDAYREGLRLAERGQWEDARGALLTAAELHPRPGKRVKTYGLNFIRNYDPYYHLARVELELGLLGEARGHLLRSKRARVMPRVKLDLLARRIAAARAGGAKTAAAPERLPPPPSTQEPEPAATPRLALTSAPEDADVFVDGRLVGATPVELPLEAGTHRLELRAEGYERRKAVVELTPGEHAERHFALSPRPPAAATTTAPGPAPVPAEKIAAPETPRPVPPSTREAVAEKEEPPAGPARPTRSDPALASSAPSQDRQDAPGQEAASSPARSARLAAGDSTGLAVGSSAGFESDSAAKLTAGQPEESPVENSPAGDVPPQALPDGQDGPPARAPAPSPWQRRLVRLGALGLVLVAALAVPMMLSRRRRARRSSMVRDARTQPVGATVEMPRTQWTPSFAGSTGPPEAEGTAFGGYVLQALLGRGGMASTYAALRRRDGRPAAVKIPYAHLLDEEEFVQRFLREGALGATLHHPNIVRIYEAGEVEGTPFIAMELVEGETLEALLEESGPPGLRQGLEILRGIALALDYAHLKGVIHRDLKPENVMCLEGGGVKVMDYGIARVIAGSHLTATHSFLGTPNYAAPESADPGAVDGRSDLYSLGIIGYRLLTGCLPFSGRSALEIIDHHRRTPLPPFPPEAQVPAEVEAMIRRLTSKSRQARPATAEELLRELNQLLNTLPATEPVSP